MALSAGGSGLDPIPVGIERHHYSQAEEEIYLPGTPGTTYSENDQLIVTAGILAVAGANGQGLYRCKKTVVCPASSVAFQNFSGRETAFWDPSDAKAPSLIPVSPQYPVGTKILRATFSDHKDDTVTSWTPGTLALVVGTGMAVNDYPNNAIVYCYAGTGAGQVNQATDYVHGTLTLTMLRIFDTPLDSTSKVIVLSGEAVATRGIGPCGLIGLNSTGDGVVTNQNADDGKYRVNMDWRGAARLLQNLTVTMVSNHLLA